MSKGTDTPAAVFISPGVALVPEDFTQRLEALKEMTGLSWEGMAAGMGVDPRQLWRWRHGGAMLALVRGWPRGCRAGWPCSWTRTWS